MRKILVLFTLCFVVFSCKSDTQTTEAGDVSGLEAMGLPDDFQAFYDLFHQDSLFQLEHTVWPLEGKVVADSVGGSANQSWDQESWRMHKPLELGENFVRELEIGDEDLVIERVRTTAGSYLIERRFAKFGGMWMLIYYRQAEMGG